MEAVGIVGRKANSSSAVDKLKKKKKKKKRIKEGKRSSVSGGSTTRSPEDPDGMFVVFMFYQYACMPFKAIGYAHIFPCLLTKCRYFYP